MGLLDALFTNVNTGGGNALGVSVTIASDGIFNDADTKDAGVVLASVPSARTVTGRRRFSGMQAEQTWQNLGPGDLVMRHNDGSVAAADRIVSPTAADYVVRAGKSVTLIDDAASSRTRIALPDADRSALADKALVVEGYTTTEVYALPKVIGAIYQTTGLATDIDRKSLRMVCATGAATVDKIVVVWSGTDLLGVPCHLRVTDPYPCYPMRTGLLIGDGVADDSTAVETILATSGVDFVIEDGAIIRITREVAPVPSFNCTLRSASERSYYGAPFFWPGPRFLWDGPGTDATMLKLASAWMTLRGFAYTTAAGRTLGRYIDHCGYLAGTTSTGTTIAGSTSSAILVSGSLSPNTLAGRVLLIAGEYRLISANTSSSISVSTPFTSAPGAGVSYSVTQWNHGTKLTIEDTVMQPGYVSNAFVGTYKQGITTGYNPSFGNCDFLTIKNTLIRQFDDCAVWLKDGQPLGTVLDGVLFGQDGRLNAASQSCCYGTGVRASVVAASVTCRDMNWGPLSVGIDAGAEVRFWLDGSQDGEYLKRFAQGPRLHLATVGGRVEMAPPLAYGVASAAPIIAAEDNAWIDTTGGGGGGSVILSGMGVFSGEGWCIRANANCRIDLRGMGFPVADFLRIAAPDGNGLEADVTILSSAAVVTSYEDLPGVDVEPVGSVIAGVERHLVTISGDTTVGGVSWRYRRPSLPLLDAPRVVATTGTPASGALTGATYLTPVREGVTLKLAAAPGAGASVTYEVVARPNRRQDAERTKVFERMAPSSARRETASGTSGLVAGSTWWMAGLAVRMYEEDPSPGANVVEAFAAIDDAGGSPLVTFGMTQAAGATYFLPRIQNAGDDVWGAAFEAAWFVGRLLPWLVTYDSGQLRAYVQTNAATINVARSIAALSAGARIRVGGAGGSYMNKWGSFGVAVGTGAFTTRVDGPNTVCDAFNKWMWSLYRTRRWQPPTDTGIVCTHSWRTDGGATLANAGTAGSAGNVSTISGAVATKASQWAMPQYAPEPIY